MSLYNKLADFQYDKISNNGGTPQCLTVLVTWCSHCNTTTWVETVLKHKDMIKY